MSVKKVLGLDRRFFTFPSGSEIELEHHIAISGALRELKAWSDILSLRYAIILGEAGSGKTTEFRETARKLTESGQAAFFVAVEALANEGLAAALSFAEQAPLRSWIEGSGPATFFFDSLDEAKLQTLTLERALRRFAAEVGAALPRSRVLISCRVSDWHVFTDRDVVERILGSLVAADQPTSEEARPGLNIFGLAPLTIEQVAALAESLGVSEPQAFISAIGDARAGVFVERPVDVEWMVQHWNRTRTLGSLSELLRSNVQEKLRDDARPPRAMQLSTESSTSGVTQLAGVAALSGRISFLASGAPEDRINDPKTIVPEDVLKGWPRGEIAELLSLPIFDESTLGRVRMHHRAVQEYLAADWLRRLRAAGLPRRELDRLLLPTTPYLPKPLLPAHLRGVAAWLATDDPVLRSTLLSVAPDVLLGEGDPSAIPVDERRAILVAYTDRFRGRRRVFETIERAALRRFAFDGLATTITSLATDSGLADEVRGTLLAIVAEGKIAACAETAMRIAEDKDQPSRLRVEAIRAASAAGASDLKARLFAMAAAADVDHEIAATVLEALFPGQMSVTELVEFLKLVAPKKRNLLTSLQYFMEHELDGLCGQDVRLDLLANLLPLSRTDGRLSWLPKTMVSLLEGAWAALPDGTSLPKEVADVLAYFEESKRDHHSEYSYGIEEVEGPLANRPLTRRQLFWDRVAQKEAAASRRMTRYHDVAEWWWLFEISSADFSWLSDDALTAKDSAAQVLAFDTILWARYSDADKVARDALIRDLSQRSPLLAEHLRRTTTERATPSADSERHRRLMQAISLRRAKELAGSREVLQSILPLIKQGKHASALMHLRDRGRHLGTRWANFDDETVRKDYGDEIADAAREGLRNYWKTAEVPAPGDWKDGGSVPTAVVLGLTGLELDLAAGFDLLAAHAEQRRLAVRLAAWELNALPEWLPTVAPLESEETRRVFEALLEKECDAPDGVSTSDVLGKILRSPQELKQILAPFIARRLSEKPPARRQTLSQAFRVIETTRGQDAKPIVKRASEEYRRAGIRPDVKAAWFVFWVNQDAFGALDALTAEIDHLERKDAVELVEEILAQTWEAADATLGQAAVRIHENAESVARLLPIAFKYVPREGDVWHESTYHPGRRDHAQTMRDRLVASLASLPPAESVRRLSELSTQPEFAEMRDYLLHKAYEQVGNHPDCLPWLPDQVISWSEKFVRDPDTAAHLYLAVSDVLDDIKAAQERGDHSLKAMFNPPFDPVHEKPVQVMVVAELNREARGRFSAVLEEEVGKENYPDIRVHNPKVTGAIALEVKIAERWSYNDLASALRDQLAAQYLRARSSRYGILIVASSGPPKTWRTPDGRTIASFEALVKELRLEAERVRAENGMDGIAVVGIDFH